MSSVVSKAKELLGGDIDALEKALESLKIGRASCRERV